jgi:membrane protein
MFFYIGIFAICFIAAILNDKLKNEKEKRIFEISILIFLCIISGTRYNLGGTDYFVYKTVYDVVPTINEFNFESVQNINGTFGMEKGYLLYNSIIKTLGFSFYGFTLINSIIFYTCLYIGLKRYIKNFNFFLIIFLYKMFFYDTFISMRQSVSMVIFFIALQFIEKKKPVKYWILCTIALFFHNSAIILFPLYFIRNFKISKKTFMIINIVGLIFLILNITGIFVFNPINVINILFSNNSIALEKSNSYFDITEKISIIHSLEYFVIAIILYFNYEYIQNKNDKSKLVINIFIILMFIFTVMRGFVIITRIKDYFLWTYSIILYYLMENQEIKKKNIIAILVCVVCLYGYIRYLKSFDNGGLIPYNSYLNDKVSIYIEK